MADNKSKNESSKEVAKTNTSIATKSRNLPDRLSALDTFKILAKSAGTGIKSEGEAMLMAMKAKELGIGFGNAIPHMHVINGKPGIDIHIIKALLLRPSSGVVWEKVEDYVPVYRYVTKDGLLFTHDMLPHAYQQIEIVPLDQLKKLPNTIEKLHVAYLPSKEDINVPEVYDRRTSYIFKRYVSMGNKTIERISKAGTFSWQEALAAKLPFDKQGNMNPDSAWSKYRKIQIDHRAFTFGARDIASDLLMGNYETSELYDIEGIDYDIVDSDGEIVIEAEEVNK